MPSNDSKKNYIMNHLKKGQIVQTRNNMPLHTMGKKKSSKKDVGTALLSKEMSFKGTERSNNHFVKETKTLEVQNGGDPAMQKELAKKVNTAYSNMAHNQTYSLKTNNVRVNKYNPK